MASTTIPVSSTSFPASSFSSRPGSAYRNASGSASVDATRHLSPPLPPLHGYRSDSASPNHQTDIDTPANSYSTFDRCQSSEFGDDDPFFGVDFNHEGGTPSFLEESLLASSHASSLSPKPNVFSANNHHSANITAATNAGANLPKGPNPTYPLSPDLASSPQLLRKRTLTPPPTSLPTSVSPLELQRPFNKASFNPGSFQFTPSGSSQSSDDGLATAPPASVMPPQSLLVTVSDWGKNNLPSSQTIETAFEADQLVRPPSVRSTPGALISPLSNDASGAFRDDGGNWLRNPVTGQRGLDPENRPRTAIDSVNDMASKREIEERKKVVASWLDKSSTEQLVSADAARTSIDQTEIEKNIRDDEIPLGDRTENKYVPGQTYFFERGGEMTQQDLEIIYSNRNWADAPLVHPITTSGSKRYQPESSQAAIAKFERMCQDNASIISDAATCGTRPRSLAAWTDADIELTGNLLKKLAISRGDPRKSSGGGGLLNGFRELVRNPSATLKRSLSNHDEAGFSNAAGDKHDNTARLAPPSRSSSWGKKPTPSINTALLSMGQSVAAVGAGQAGQVHGRSGSISATSVTSPKSPFGGLTVKNPIRRPRSKSDLPRSNTKLQSGNNTNSSLVDLWKKNGGPPVGTIATLAITVPAEAEDDDDDEYDFEDGEMRVESGNLIDSITPNFEGFKSHILRLNPTLSPNSYLVDRIAHQQTIRYKALLSAKVKHAQQGSRCPCGSLCIAMGGSATPLDQRGEVRHTDGFSSPDNDLTPIEGVLTQESFPQDIPMPPTATLPAEIECQLCYQAKKFQKPSDWTKHVHEDVQPFTCTWEKCKDPKIFKRKADWVRHENEGHRHLEWWECDVDDCTHKCYRRDNFLQHLVREHKFEEPKFKTKAALKRNGGNDPTWQKVEKCHVETDMKAQDEPCRFCGKHLQSWKKLTVHLAKHMEQISLPTLRLVAAKNVTADTIISPVQDAPPRQAFAFPSPQDALHSAYPTSDFNGHSGHQQHQRSPMGTTTPVSIPYQGTTGGFDFNVNHAMAPGTFREPYLNSQFGGNAMENGLGTVSNIPGAVNVGQERLFYGQSQQAPSGSLHHPVQGVQRVQSLPIDASTYIDTGDSGAALPIQTMADSYTAASAGLGLQEGTQYMGMPVNLGGMMDPNGGVFTPGGSISPYSRSPHQAPSGHFYHSQ